MGWIESKVRRANVVNGFTFRLRPCGRGLIGVSAMRKSHSEGFLQHLWVRPLGKHHYINCTSWNKNVVWQIPTDTEPKFGPLLDPKWHRKILGVSVRPMDWFQVGKGVHQSCILSSCLFNFYAEYIIRNARLDEAKAGIKISGRNINNFRYADDSTLMAQSEELKGLLMKVKKESGKPGLKSTFRKRRLWHLVPSLHGK